MMNPSAYRQEEERYEAAQASAHIRREEEQRPAANNRCLYSREVLPGGCILYRMTAQKELQ
jgi:hypothetical protein